MIDPERVLLNALQKHALILGEVTLTSGRTAQYYVDCKRAYLRPMGFGALGQLVTRHANALGATAVGGLTMGADPIACAALGAGFGGTAFFVRKEAKAHGLQRRIEGPDLTENDRVLIVEDVVTSGGSTIEAIRAVQDQLATGHIVGVMAVLDRLAGGREAIEHELRDEPGDYVSILTIDDLYPERPDR